MHNRDSVNSRTRETSEHRSSGQSQRSEESQAGCFEGPVRIPERNERDAEEIKARSRFE